MLVKKKKNYTKTTNSFHAFVAKSYRIGSNPPEQVWVVITYIKTEQVYLSLSQTIIRRKYRLSFTKFKNRKYHKSAGNAKSESTPKDFLSIIQQRVSINDTFT